VATRLKAVWLPGLGALAVSLLAQWLFPKFWRSASLTFDLGLVTSWVYFPWFLSLVAAGALAAYLSRRLGGTLAHRVAASFFPALWEGLKLSILLVVFPSQPAYTAADISFAVLSRFVVPCLALLAGPALFFRDPTPS
jgi:hypothetical protein